MGIAFGPIFEQAVDLPANSFGPLVRSRERLVHKTLRSDTPQPSRELTLGKCMKAGLCLKQGAESPGYVLV